MMIAIINNLLKLVDASQISYERKRMLAYLCFSICLFSGLTGTALYKEYIIEERKALMDKVHEEVANG